MRHREISRALQSASFGSRHLAPDSTIVNVVEQRPDGRYNVRKPHWPEDTYMAVPVVPPGSRIPCPRAQVRLLFEDADSQRPFLYWPWDKPGRRPSTGPTAGGWYCRRANFLRPGYLQSGIVGTGYTYPEVEESGSSVTLDDPLMARSTGSTRYVYRRLSGGGYRLSDLGTLSVDHSKWWHELIVSGDMLLITYSDAPNNHPAETRDNPHTMRLSATDLSTTFEVAVPNSTMTVEVTV